jgi:hypothetical protein
MMINDVYIDSLDQHDRAAVADMPEAVLDRFEKDVIECVVYDRRACDDAEYNRRLDGLHERFMALPLAWRNEIRSRFGWTLRGEGRS